MGLAWKFLLPMALINILAAGLWWFLRDTPAGWALSFVLLAASCWLLILANKPAPLQPRTYVFAE